MQYNYQRLKTLNEMNNTGRSKCPNTRIQSKAKGMTVWIECWWGKRNCIFQIQCYYRHQALFAAGMSVYRLFAIIMLVQFSYKKRKGFHVSQAIWWSERKENFGKWKNKIEKENQWNVSHCFGGIGNWVLLLGWLNMNSFSRIYICKYGWIDCY